MLTDGKWESIGHSGQYLYPVHQLGEAFKAKFLDSLKRALRKQNELPLFYGPIQKAYKTKWVVHCEPSLANAGHVVEYLGQYTHRVAITNQRILNIAGGKVTFVAKDYRDRAVKKPVTLDGVEFLRRFALHILPRRFVKIRRFGIYNHTTKRNLGLQFVPELNPDTEAVIKRKLFIPDKLTPHSGQIDPPPRRSATPGGQPMNIYNERVKKSKLIFFLLSH